MPITKIARHPFSAQITFGPERGYVQALSTKETFEVETACNKTIAKFTNRVAYIEGKVPLPIVCFNSCNTCE